MTHVTILEAAAPVRKIPFVAPRRDAVLVKFPSMCSSCAQRSTCLPGGLQQEGVIDFDQLIHSRRRIRGGEHLYRAGDAFSSLFAFRLGFFKSYVNTSVGQVQVSGFPMAGDVVGLDGIETDRHRVNVIALEDGEACVIPYAHYLAVARRVPAVQHRLHKMMSREIMRKQETMALLGSMRAKPRVAAFLLALSAKFAARGYSPVRFHLRMTREEIGSYLGLKLETVSRALSRFQEEGLLKANIRSIEIVDLAGLKALASEL